MNKELIKKCSIDFGCDDWEWNELQRQFFIENVKENWTFCDVGSCHGFFTNLFKSFNPNQIYAFDVNKNNPVIEGCVFERIAISDVDGYEFVYENGTHQSNIIGDKNSISSYEIESITLDTYFKNKYLNCLKIDIEGAELKAIKGGINTIKKCDLVLIECHFEKDWNEIFSFFKENNLDFKNLLTGDSVSLEKMPYQIYKIN